MNIGPAGYKSVETFLLSCNGQNMGAERLKQQK
jgi:hypothetical protein